MKSLSKVICVALLTATNSGYAAPDFSGPWMPSEQISQLKTIDGKAPPLTAVGKKLYQAHQADMQADPAKRCLPLGIPRLLLQKGFAIDLVMGKDLGGMFFEWNHLPRPIYLDINHFENIGPTYLGQTVGKWDGDTLVLNTQGFNDTTWLDDSGLPHTEDLVVVERVRLKDANTLEDRITLTDPKVFTQPWTTVVTLNKQPGYILKEDHCLKRTGLLD